MTGWKSSSRPTLYLVGSFGLASLLGALLLSLPGMHRGPLSFLEALFTSTSAVCVTGLTVVDTATAFTRAGQIVILLLIQIGGLGIMTFATLFFLLLGRPVPLGESLVLKESFAPYTGVRLRPLLMTMMIYTITVEGITALLLLPVFLPDQSLSEAFFQAFFHAVSAFCNAGFSTLPEGLLPYQKTLYLPTVIALAILAGNSGFPVIFEVSQKLRHYRSRNWSLHLKLTLSVHVGLIFLGAMAFLWFERDGALASLNGSYRLTNALFLSLSARTAGFTLLDLSRLSEASLFCLLFLMFVGACPGSTGGGLKTTTVGVLLASILGRLRGYSRSTIFRRSLPTEQVYRALTLTAFYAFVLGTVQFLLITTLPHRPFNAMGSVFLARLVEATSALGTVGLSTGLTPSLSAFEKGVLIGTMFVGRVGVLSLTMLLSRLSSHPKEFYYPKEEVLLG